MTTKINKDSMGEFLQDMGRIPLLTPAEEVQLGQQIQKWKKLEAMREALEQELGCEPSLHEWASAAEIALPTLQRAIDTGKRALERMVEANLRLVVTVAKRYRSSHLNLQDRIQEGSIGLQHAAEKFDPTRGYKFSTYAYWWIRQAITRAIANHDRTIRLPIHIHEKLSKIRRVRHLISTQLGRMPKLSEIAQELSMNPEDVQELLVMARSVYSLSTPAGDQGDIDLEGIVEAEGPDSYSTVMTEEIQIEVELLLDTLDERAREVIELRYGFVGNPRSLADVAERLNISRERVRQIEQQALSTLKRHARRENAVLAHACCD
jgi:RNA polymerase nonessential primary-like sigma factor